MKEISLNLPQRYKIDIILDINLHIIFMQRKFITNLGLLILLNLLIKPFWVFGIDRTVQNIVGAEDFGFYFTIFNLVSFSIYYWIWELQISIIEI